MAEVALMLIMISILSFSYESLMPMVVAALASLLGPLDDFVQRIVSRAELARMSHPFNAFKLFGKIGKSLINSTAEATVLIAKLKDVDAHTPLTTCLWRNLIDNVNELKCYDHFNLLLDNIDALAECVIVLLLSATNRLFILQLFPELIQRESGAIGVTHRSSGGNGRFVCRTQNQRSRLRTYGGLRATNRQDADAY